MAMNSMGTLLTASPNDTLGVEYIKALLASGSTMKPFAVKREGNDYHDTKLSLGFASASAIRSQIDVNQLLLFRHFQLFFLKPPFL